MGGHSGYLGNPSFHAEICDIASLHHLWYWGLKSSPSISTGKVDIISTDAGELYTGDRQALQENLLRPGLRLTLNRCPASTAKSPGL